MGKRFAAAVNCMDGRVQEPVREYVRHRFGAEYVDMITEPGPIKILDEQAPAALVDSIFTRLQISMSKHGATEAALVSHEDCGGDPVPRDRQMEQLATALQVLRTRFPQLHVIGLWVPLEGPVEELML